MRSPPRQRRSTGPWLLLVAFLAASWAPWVHSLNADHAWCDLHAQIEHGTGHGGGAEHAHEDSHPGAPVHDPGPTLEVAHAPGEDGSESDDACGLTWVGPSQPVEIQPLLAGGLLPVERVAAQRESTRARIAEALWRLAPKTSPPV